MTETFSTVWAPRFLSLLRIISAAGMMQHGAQKFFGAFGKEAQAVGSFMWFGGVIEFWVAGLLLIGLFTRGSAFLLSGTMAVAYWKAHGMKSFWPIENGGEMAMLYCFIYLYLAAAGGGPLSVDAAISKKHS